MGRIPDSKELQDAKGNPNKRNVSDKDENGDKIVIAEINSNAPDHVKKNEMAHEIWLHLTTHLRVLFKDSDRYTLARICTNQARYLKLEKIIDDQGETYTVESKHGTYERIRPEMMLMLKIETNLLKLEDRCGLSPGMRSGVMNRLSGMGAFGSKDKDQPPLPFEDGNEGFGFSSPSRSKAIN